MFGHRLSIMNASQNSFLLSVLCAGLVIRVIFVFAIGNYENPTTWENGIIADNIVGGKGFAIGFLGPEGPSSWQAPFYPYFLSLFYFVLGKNDLSFFLIQLVQALATTCVSLFVYRSARLIASEKIARWSALILAIFPLLIWYTTRIHHSAFVFFFVAWIFYLLLRANESERNIDYIFAGLAFGVGVLVEPVMIVILAAFAIWSWVKKGFRFSFVKHGIVLASILLITLPWTIRNYQVHGKVIFIKSSFGKEFWMGNNPNATGTGFAEGGKLEITYAFPPPFLAELSELPEYERNRRLLLAALSWIKDNPYHFLKLTAKKIYYFWYYPPTTLVRQIEGGESVRFDFLKKLYWGPFLFLLLIGFWSATRSGNPYALLLLLVCVFYTAVYSLTHVGQQRFRGVIEPILLPFALIGLNTILQWFQQKLGNINARQA